MGDNVIAITAENPKAPETAQCMICGNGITKVWSCDGYCYFACHHCELLKVVPVPDREVLRDYYYRAYEVDREGYYENTRKNSHRDLGLLERINGTGRMLEIGCSWGYFLEAACRRGWNVEGIELSDSAAKWARERLGLNVICGTIEDSLFVEKTSYDAVVAWHVIEHVQEPMEFLEIARSRLRPGGLLALRTPNVRSVPARINAWAWQWVGAPAHLSLFSPKSLGLAVEHAGFSVRHVETRRGDAYNPVFEVLRGGARRAGLHENAKELLKLKDGDKSTAPSVDDSRGSPRRTQMLRQISRFFDVAFCAIYPLEKLLDYSRLGPELFLVAERKE